MVAQESTFKTQLGLLLVVQKKTHAHNMIKLLCVLLQFSPFMMMNTQLWLKLYLSLPFSARKQNGPLS